jgi:hypothetical protein
MLPRPWRLDKSYVNVRLALPFNRDMKYFAVVVSALAWASVQAAQEPPPRPPAPPEPPDLRQVLQQYHPGTVAAPRQLSPAERAELRRQLTDYAQPARKQQRR